MADDMEKTASKADNRAGNQANRAVSPSTARKVRPDRAAIADNLVSRKRADRIRARKTTRISIASVALRNIEHLFEKSPGHVPGLFCSCKWRDTESRDGKAPHTFFECAEQLRFYEPSGACNTRKVFPPLDQTRSNASCPWATFESACCTSLALWTL